jgi:cytochrome P450
MALMQGLRRRVLEPAVVRVLQWRGDPLARLLGAGARSDPYPIYDTLRQHPLRRSPLGVWATASHATASSILRDQRFSSSPRHQPGYQPPSYPPGDARRDLPVGDLLTLDPPDHTRIRRLVSGAFTPRRICELEHFIRETTGGLLAHVGAAQGFDLIDAVAFPLPIAVICHLLGVPTQDQARFRIWGHDLATALEPQINPNAESRTRASELALTAYLRALVERRRADPDNSLLSGLIAIEEDGSRLSSDELVSTALLLLVAGFETTVNLIGNGTVALLTQREAWHRLGTDPQAVPGAVEELLRYDSPVQLTSRIATQDVDLNGSFIPRGAPVIVALGGANRDPDVFDEPDQLRLDRPGAARHLAFSLGIHHCLGAALARLEGRVAFEELTRRYPRLSLAGPPTRRPLLVFRGFEHVPVRV